MMIAMLLLSVIYLVTTSVSVSALGSCTVGEWNEWSLCTSSKHCPLTSDPEPSSYPLEAHSGWDAGRSRMQQIRKSKEDRKRWREECIPAGTCPELMGRPSSGSFMCEEGLAGDIPCNNVHQWSFVNVSDLGYSQPLPNDTAEGNDIWGWTDPESLDEYAIVGLTGGTSFVRVTDPANPVPVAFMYTATEASIWRDIKVVDNYAYIVSEASGHGLQVFDLTRLQGLTSLQYLEPDAVSHVFGNAHNIVANEATKFIYVVGATEKEYPDVCEGGLLIFDVRDPLEPKFVTCFGTDGYVHDAQCVVYSGPDTEFVGNEICFCFNEDSLTIVDVTDKQDIEIIAKVSYLHHAYTHQGWVTEDHTIVLLDDELDEYEEGEPYTKTYVWDITYLRIPLLKYIYQSSQTSIDHNQYIVGDYTYQSNYEAGLRVLRINRQTYELTEVAYFDVFPSRTSVAFYGTWSVYPFFSSGTVVVNSIDYGLFVVRLDWDGIEAQLSSGQTYAEETRTRPLISNQPGATCPPLSESRTCSASVLC